MKDMAMTVDELNRAIAKFREISPDITALTMLTFLAIGKRGVCVQKDIENDLGMTNAACSRNVNYWTKKGRSQHDYVMRYEDEQDRRYNRLRLTREGQEFYDALLRRGLGGYNNNDTPGRGSMARGQAA